MKPTLHYPQPSGYRHLAPVEVSKMGALSRLIGPWLLVTELGDLVTVVEDFFLSLAHHSHSR